MADPKKVQFPGKAYKDDGDDLAEPLKNLLLEAHVIEDKADVREGDVKDTPFSLQVITAGAMTLSKFWASAVAALGGAGALAVGLQPLGFGSDDPIAAAAFTAAAGVLGAATVIAVAIIVRSDVMARSAASTAQYEARASIASSMLQSAQYNKPIPPKPAVPEPRYMLQTKGHEWFPVTEFILGGGGEVFAKVRHLGSPISSKDWETIVATSAWNTSP